MYYYQMYVENNRNIYTYKSQEKYETGEWCIVNFVNRNIMGLVLSEANEKELTVDTEKIKFISGRAPVLSIPLPIMDLVKWIKDYYLSDYNSVIKAVYPGILKLNYSKKAVYVEDLKMNKKDTDVRLFGKEKEEWKNTGKEKKNRINGEIYKKTEITIKSENEKSDDVEKFNEYMKRKQEVTFPTLQKNFSGELINKAVKEKSIIIEKKIIIKTKAKQKPELKNEILRDDVILNDEQQNASDRIKRGKNQFYLLKGVTGSGKTEIYINLIKEAVKAGYGSIFLVPEISLTAQMVERLERQFSDSIAILHSKLSASEKKQEWSFIRTGEKKIVIGARSAIFAPVENLKYIIIDEEHENTYKQDNNPRYHVKNVAIKRALIEKNVKVILGSATPSFESYYQAEKGDLELIELKKRFNSAKIPEYEIVDLNDTTDNFSDSFSGELLKEMSETLGRKEQVLLILNRKAFSNLIKCKECGHIPVCPNCSISLSYYKYENKLKCNYCGYEEKFEKKCENCGSDKLIRIGSGTEKIEEELKEIFYDGKIVRIDSENVKTKKDYENIYNDFKNQKYNIMLGTQIIAKGFHFPNVTLVGIVNSDIILNFPDFRAGEKTFQLLVQSAGRAGRAEKKGKVIIQTFNRENEVIRKTVKNDYEGYFRKEMEMRKLLNYPPYGRLIIIVLSSDEEAGLKEKAELFYDRIINMIKTKVKFQKNEFVSEPFKAPIYKIKGRFRYQIFIKFNRNNIAKIKNIIRTVMNGYNEKNIRISVDVDPVSML